MGVCLSRPHTGPPDSKGTQTSAAAQKDVAAYATAPPCDRTCGSIRHRSDTASAHSDLAGVRQKADAVAAWKAQQLQEAEQPPQQQDSLPSTECSWADSAKQHPAAPPGGSVSSSVYSGSVSSSAYSGSAGSESAGRPQRRSPFADARSPFAAIAGIANPAVAGARGANENAAAGFRSPDGGRGGVNTAEAAHDVASAAASCFADNCISTDQDLSQGPPQPTPLRVADAASQLAITPQQVAHVPGVVLPADLAEFVAADLAGQPYDSYRRGPPVPPCDVARVEEMTRYGPIEGPAEPDPNVQHVLDLLCQVFRVENVLLALFGDRRIYIRNSKGFQRGDFPWRWSFCAWSMVPPEPEILLVEDTKKDARFTDNDVANGLGVRFYCGAPLLGSGGARLGTLCFVDSKPRTFAAEQLLILANLSEVVVRELEREIVDKSRRSRAETFMARALECFDAGVAFVDTSQPEWRALHCSSAFTKATGITMAAARATPLWRLLCPPGGCAAGGPGAASWAEACGVMASHRREFMLTGLTVAGRPELGAFALRFRPAGRDALDEHTLPIGIPVQAKSDSTGTAAGQFYFAILAAAPQGSMDVSSHPPSRVSSAASLSALRSPSAGLHRASGVLQPDAVPFDGLELGPLVGRGSFGRVYRGHWQDKTVAVKICGPLGGGKTAYPDVVKSVEAIASSKLHHPNVVRAFRHCTILAHAEPLSSAPSMMTVSEHSTASFAPPLPPPPQLPAAAASSGLPPGSPAAGSQEAGSGGSSNSGGQLTAKSEGGARGQKPRRLQPPAFVNPFAAANAAKQLKAVSAPGSRKPSFQSPFSAANTAKLTVSAPGSVAASPAQGTPGGQADAKAAPSFSAFTAVRTAALAMRGDSARCSMDGVAATSPAAGFPASPASRAAAADAASTSVAAAAAAAPPAAVGLPAGGAADITARRLKAAADRVAAAQLLRQMATGGTGSTSSGGQSSGDHSTNGSGSSSGANGVSITSSLLSASSDASNADIETWLLLEYCDLGTLQSAVDKGVFRAKRATKDGPPHLPIILAAASEIAAAMAYLHGRGVVHGDLAGGNVLLCSAADAPHGFACKVSDFGLARLMSLQGRINTDTYGTVTHMPPELLTGGDLSPAVDVYSFGVLLWEMYCGTRAWAGLSTAQVIMAVTVKGRTPAFPADTPVEFALLANACMSADPGRRPTFVDLEHAIARLRLMHPAA